MQNTKEHIEESVLIEFSDIQQMIAFLNEKFHLLDNQVISCIENCNSFIKFKSQWMYYYQNFYHRVKEAFKQGVWKGMKNWEGYLPVFATHHEIQYLVEAIEDNLKENSFDDTIVLERYVELEDSLRRVSKILRSASRK